MATTNNEIAFYKSLCDILATHGYPARDTVVAYLRTCEPTPQSGKYVKFDTTRWANLVVDFGRAIDASRINGPAQALQIIVDVTEAAAMTEAHGDYCYLMLSLFDDFTIRSESRLSRFGLWEHVRDSHDAMYCLALYMLIGGYNSRYKRELSEAVSVALGVQVNLVGNDEHVGENMACRNQVATAMFGPVWQALYLGERTPADFYFESIWRQRPAIFGKHCEAPVFLTPPSDVGFGC